MLTINGWTILAHPLFLDQLEKLTGAVEALKAKKPDQYQENASTKLLAALNKLVFQMIPADPTAPAYRQGATLGDRHKHWFRAKFGSGRFRLFFRYDTRSKIIIFAWVNDGTTLRTYGPKLTPTTSSRGCWTTAIRPTTGPRCTRQRPSAPR